jgi:uncharacterized protein (DUF2336 family)
MSPETPNTGERAALCESPPGGGGFAANDRQGLIEQLESTIASREERQRADVLRQITDLFVAGSSLFSSEQVGLFDDIMCRLVTEVETSARSSFGERVAELDYAPPNVVRTLANDEAIEVAGPILSGYGPLDEVTLVAAAKTKSQDHLLAISRRSSLGEAVTDVLVERGDRRVAISTVANGGSRLSDFGCSTLVKRSANDGDLALQLWSRPDVPRQYLLRLLAECSETVRRGLAAGGRRRAEVLRDLIALASDQLQARSREASAKCAVARERVDGLHEAGKLSEDSVHQFARSGNFDETAMAISRICALPISIVERAMVHDTTEQIIVIARAARFSWRTTKAIIAVRAGSRGNSPHEMQKSFANFNKLNPETAERAMLFYRLRERVARTMAQ